MTLAASTSISFSFSPSPQLLKEEAADPYHRWIKYLLVPLLAAYIIRAAMQSHSSVPQADGTILSTARDTGLRMSTTAPLPVLYLALHAGCGAALIALCLAQKELVRKMPLSVSARQWHRRLGWLTVALMVGMACAGLAMSAWPDPQRYPLFALYNLFFALPWLLWAAALLWTGRPKGNPKDESQRTRRLALHALAGNLSLKSCVAVPLARFISAELQQRTDLDEATAYYTGIGTAAAVIGLWALEDVWRFVQRMRRAWR